MHIAHAQQPKEKMRLFGHRSKGPSRVFGRAIGLPATTTRLAAKRSMLIYRVTYTWQWSDGSLLKLSLSYTSITFAFSLHRPRVLFLSASLRPSVYNAKTSSPYAETERERVNINTLLMDREFNTQVPSSKCHISKGSRVDLMLISREEL